MESKNRTPKHIKELRKIRAKLAKEYLKDPMAYLEKISEEGERWRKEVLRTKKAA